MRYFDSITNDELLKARFRQLAKELHPDHGGNEEAFADMLAQYKDAMQKKSGRTAQTIFEKIYQELSAEILQMDKETIMAYLDLLEGLMPDNPRLKRIKAIASPVFEIIEIVKK